MGTLFVLLAILLVLAVVAIAVWLWLFIDIVYQVSELIRIKVEEQVAIWRIEAIARVAQLEQRQVRDEHRARSAKDVQPLTTRLTRRVDRHRGVGYRKGALHE